MHVWPMFNQKIKPTQVLKSCMDTCTFNMCKCCWKAAFSTDIPPKMVLMSCISKTGLGCEQAMVNFKVLAQHTWVVKLTSSFPVRGFRAFRHGFGSPATRFAHAWTLSESHWSTGAYRMRSIASIQYKQVNRVNSSQSLNRICLKTWCKWTATIVNNGNMGHARGRKEASNCSPKTKNLLIELILVWETSG